MASVSVRGQQPTVKDFATIETAWASGRRLANTVVTIRRGFNLTALLESASTDGTGIARTTTKYWERIEVHLPQIGTADTLACLMINSKCNALPVGASLDKKNSILYWHVDGTGHGLPAASAIRIQSDGTRTPVTLMQYSAAASCTPVPIDLSVDGTVYLSVYGTGFGNTQASVGC